MTKFKQLGNDHEGRSAALEDGERDTLPYIAHSSARDPRLHSFVTKFRAWKSGGYAP